MSAPAPDVAWVKGGQASVARVEGERVSLRSTVPWPPGSRVDGSLGDGGTVRLKVHACRREPDGEFLIEGRLLDASRDLRDHLARLASTRLAPHGQPAGGDQHHDEPEGG